MKYELRAIRIRSLILSGVPAVLFALGLFGGAMTFVIMPGQQVEELGVSQRLLAAGMFSLLYMFLMVAVLIVAAFLYNFFTQTVGLRGLCVDLAGAEDSGAEPVEEAGQG